MLGAVLSVLLFGMLPAQSFSAVDQLALHSITVAAPLPLSGSASELLSLPQGISASGVLIEDLESGQRLVARNAENKRSIGSLTKLMTALLITENHSMDEVVTVPKDISKVEGSVAHLRPGDRYTVGNLLTALLVDSANDAAATLAQYDGGSVDIFVAKMNERAEELGLRDTLFATPDGMDRLNQWSTAQDVAWLAQFDLRHPEIRSRMSMPRATIQDIAGHQQTMQNTHELLHDPGPVIAGKTGTTGEAGQCLLSIVQEGRREYIVVLLGSNSRYVDMRMVLRGLAALIA